MGVPALFRWLSTKYPKIASRVLEEDAAELEDGTVVPVDITQPNPNGSEFDNLYLDMNGIVHPCTHPENKPPPATEQEAMKEIFLYIDRIMAMVRPRKLLYMAIDGVAPRAKMNQQRSRRFRAAQEAQLKQEEEDKIRREWQDKGQALPEMPKNSMHRFDSNCITPGTPFMAMLARSLQYYITERMNSDPGWQNLEVILSDASVPGEGEHKIMQFIRGQRTCPTYDPNTSHVLYGLDADLIMLGLATHEPHFKILREDVFAQEGNKRACAICGQAGHDATQCQGKPKEKLGEFGEKDKGMERKPFVFLHVNILREYLDFELRIPGLPFTFDLERAIDDWVFMCFFVGNDFLPHLPSLEIREGAIDRLIEIYKRRLPEIGDYLTHDGAVSLEHVQVIMEELGNLEDEIFRKRREAEVRREQNAKRRKEEQDRRNVDSESATTALSLPQKISAGVFKEKTMKFEEKVDVRSANMSAAQVLRASLTAKVLTVTSSSPDTVPKRPRPINDEGEEEKESNTPVKRLREDATGERAVEEDDELDVDAATDSSSNDEPIEVKEKECAPLKEEDQEPQDEVRLWEPGWKERFYQSKFDVAAANDEFRRKVVVAYAEGLCWVMKYYYQGCQSWKWFYPYHYAPFASDFSAANLAEDVDVNFSEDHPSQPYEQLMAVLPAASKDHIPVAYQKLMTDEASPIRDFYPVRFKIDLNGKKYAWQGVALLPFIEESRLLAAMKIYSGYLNEEEQERNKRGNDLLFVSRFHSLYEFLCNLYGKGPGSGVLRLDVRLSCGLHGHVGRYEDVCIPGSTYYSPLKEVDLQDISDNTAICACYHNPSPPKKPYVYPAKLLRGLRMPSRVLSPDDLLVTHKGGDRQGGNRRPYHITQQISRNFVGRYTESNNQQRQEQYRSYGYGESRQTSRAWQADYQYPAGERSHHSGLSSGRYNYAEQYQGYGTSGYLPSGGYQSYSAQYYGQAPQSQYHGYAPARPPPFNYGYAAAAPTETYVPPDYYGNAQRASNFDAQGYRSNSLQPPSVTGAAVSAPEQQKEPVSRQAELRARMDAQLNKPALPVSSLAWKRNTRKKQ